MQALFIRSCHEDVIFARKSHNCAGIAFVQGDSAGGSKLTEQTIQDFADVINFCHLLQRRNFCGKLCVSHKANAQSKIVKGI